MIIIFVFIKLFNFEVKIIENKIMFDIVIILIVKEI